MPSPKEVLERKAFNRQTAREYGASVPDSFGPSHDDIRLDRPNSDPDVVRGRFFTQQDRFLNDPIEANSMNRELTARLMRQDPDYALGRVKPQVKPKLPDAEGSAALGTALMPNKMLPDPNAPTRGMEFWARKVGNTARGAAGAGLKAGALVSALPLPSVLLGSIQDQQAGVGFNEGLVRFLGRSAGLQIPQDDML